MLEDGSSKSMGLEGVTPENGVMEVVLDVECGPNKAHLYLSRLCQGSKGPCVLLNGAWLTPNELQYVSGRETAKDWKRSIRHHGKSLKLLMAKGILSLQPPVCRCETCTGIAPPSSPQAGSQPAEDPTRVAALNAEILLARKAEARKNEKKSSGPSAKSLDKSPRNKVPAAEKTPKKSTKKEAPVAKETTVAMETNNNVPPSKEEHAPEEEKRVSPEIKAPASPEKVDSIPVLAPAIPLVETHPVPEVKAEPEVKPEPEVIPTVDLDTKIEEPTNEIKEEEPPKLEAVVPMDIPVLTSAPVEIVQAPLDLPGTAEVTSTTPEEMPKIAEVETKECPVSPAIPQEATIESIATTLPQVTPGVSKVFAPTAWPPVDELPSTSARIPTPPLQRPISTPSPKKAMVVMTPSSLPESTPSKAAATPSKQHRTDEKERERREKDRKEKERKEKERDKERRKEAEERSHSPERRQQEKAAASRVSEPQPSPTASSTSTSGVCSREEYMYYVQRQQQLYDLYKAHYMQYQMPAAQVPYPYLPVPLTAAHPYTRSLPYWCPPYNMTAQSYPWGMAAASTAAASGLVPDTSATSEHSSTAADAFSPRKRTYDSAVPATQQDLAMDLSAKRLKLAEGKPSEYSALDVARAHYQSAYMGMHGLPTQAMYPGTSTDMDRALASMRAYAPEDMSKFVSSEQQYSEYAKALASSFPTYMSMSSHLIGH